MVAVSSAIADQAHDLLGVPRTTLAVIPNGRDSAAYHPPTGDMRRSEPPLVLFVGQLESGKMPLEQLLGGYQRGAELLKFCRDKLQAVEDQIKVLDDGVLKPWTQE